jgi:predicted ArsR family transcriptional regulator
VATSASPDFIDHEEAKGLTHPLRVEILAEFGTLAGGMMSASEFAEPRGLATSMVSHHFRRLEKWGYIEQVDEKKRRGATEYFYRARRKHIFEGEEWSHLPLSVREGASRRTMSGLLSAVSRASEAGTFEDRPEERALAFDNIVLDEYGWKKLAVAFRELIDVAVEESKEAEKRLDESGEKGVSAGWGLLLFVAPDRAEEKGSKE